MSASSAMAEQAWRAMTLRAGYNTSMVVIAASLLGLAAGVVGTFALLRKRALMADALSHAGLPGIALAFIAATLLGGEGRSVPVLLLGAAASGVVGVLVVQWLSRATRLSEDAAIGIVLSVFFGAGVVGLSVIQHMSVGTQGGLKAFIYGQTAAMSAGDARLMAALAAVAIASALLLHKEFGIACFDAEFARVTGWPVHAIDLLMMALVVTVAVAGFQAVGLILVVALLIIPAAAARFWTDRLWVMVAAAGAFGAASGYLGAVASSLAPRKPAGAVIVLTAGAIFGVSMLAAPRRGVLAEALRRARYRVRIASEHALKALSERGPLHAREVGGARGWSRATAWMVGRRLAWGGLVERAGDRWTLTERGRAEGARVVRNHRLWERYLTTFADVAPSHVDWSADQVEHVLTPELVEEIERELARGRDAP